MSKVASHIPGAGLVSKAIDKVENATHIGDTKEEKEEKQARKMEEERIARELREKEEKVQRFVFAIRKALK
jgi:hypothetical protein